MSNIEKLTAAVAETEAALNEAGEAFDFAKSEHNIALEALAICTLAEKYNLRIGDKIRIVRKDGWYGVHEGKTGLIESVGWHWTGERLEVQGRLFKKDGTLGSRTFETANFEKV